MNIIASKNDLVIFETFNDYKIMNKKTDEIVGLGDGCDVFLREDGTTVPPGTPEFEMAYQGYLDSYYEDFLEGYFENRA